ncbi:MAG: proline iminopeptidase-family hydrolase [Nitrososphaerales archaeon]
MDVKEGIVNATGFKIFFRSTGEAKGSSHTLLGLHGGPGASLDYLKVLEELTGHGYRIVLYNQLGSDRSEMPSDNSHFTIDHFVEEAEGVRASLNLGKVHLLGHSWGGMLALAYALKYQDRLKSLIISSGLASVPLAQKETDRLVNEMPEDGKRVLRKYTNEGVYDNKEYLDAYQKYYRDIHSFRQKERPEELGYTLQHMSRKVYYYMNGPSDLNMSGTLKDWDVTDQLDKIDLPCLITVGKYDSVTPRVSESIYQGIRGSELVLFEKSGHFAMWEEKEKFLDVLRRFLDKNS